MQYQFPVDIQLDEVRRVISEANEEIGATAFIEADRGDHVIFNYLVAFANSFPYPQTGDPARDRDLAIRRECRGLIFAKDGRLLSRRYQKFFNVNEKEETQVGFVDWSRPSLILDKLDGSMITPMLVGDSLRFCTKMGLTGVAQPVDEFVAERGDYNTFCRDLMSAGVTPIFEWCSRRQKIVIDYPEDMLVLTGVRDNRTGAYWSHHAMRSEINGYAIPLVRSWGTLSGDVQDFITETRGLKNAEGYIVRFDDGGMVKMKADEYCTIHRAKDELALEKNVWALYFADKIDDVKAMLDASDRARLDGFADAMTRGIEASAKRLAAYVEAAKALVGPDRRRFATEVVAKDRELDPSDWALVFDIFNGKDPLAVVRALLSKKIFSQTQIDEYRKYVGDVRWYSNAFDGDA